MSKKTNAEKQAAARKRAAARPRKRMRRPRPNPARHEIREIKMPPCLTDGVFLCHVAGALSRYLELQYPAEYAIVRFAAENPPTPDPIVGYEKVDAEFVAPEAAQPDPSIVQSKEKES